MIRILLAISQKVLHENWCRLFYRIDNLLRFHAVALFSWYDDVKTPNFPIPSTYPTFEKVRFRAKIADARHPDFVIPMRGRLKGLENTTVKLNLAGYVKGVKMTPKWGKYGLCLIIPHCGYIIGDKTLLWYDKSGFEARTYIWPFTVQLRYPFILWGTKWGHILPWAYYT